MFFCISSCEFLSLIHTTGLILRVETGLRPIIHMAGPQNWRVRLDYALVLGSRLSTIRHATTLLATFQLLVTGALFTDNPSRQKSQ